jgi:uncharacterized protein (DUF983 family)
MVFLNDIWQLNVMLVKWREKMGRKKRCPKCGSGKIDEYSVPKRCKVCGYTWTGTGRAKIPKKDKVRF